MKKSTKNKIKCLQNAETSGIIKSCDMIAKKREVAAEKNGRFSVERMSS